jgi:hypothetical protein
MANGQNASVMKLYFSDQFGVAPETLEQYGAFDVSVISDLPLFIDPFLLFNSEKPEYQTLHDEILRYLTFLRDEAVDTLDPALISNWYRFKEVKQNWLGYTVLGNGGAGLGTDFAGALHNALNNIFQGFGNETITRGSHLEKLCLIQPGVGKDNISDFTTNLIKGYLLDYTQTFARRHLTAAQCDSFAVPRAVFNYDTKSWATRSYYLPHLGGDFVLLTPADMLTRDDTWISHADMIRKFNELPIAMPDDQLRAQVNQYFASRLGPEPKAKERAAAAQRTIEAFPALIDYYIRLKEDDGDRAEAVSTERVDDMKLVLVAQIKQLVEKLAQHGGFYDKPASSYTECLTRAKWFKDYVENQDGYKLINRAGQPFSRESEVHLFFGLIWYHTAFDVNREVNNGRGPVDFKVSAGSLDKTLIEFKLGSNKALKRNLEKQVAIYEAANRTHASVKVIVYYTEADEKRVKVILKELGILGDESIVLIDARADNKTAASKA